MLAIAVREDAMQRWYPSFTQIPVRRLNRKHTDIHRKLHITQLG